MKLFIIDWTKEKTTPLLDYCKKAATVTGYELADGAEAYRKTALNKPDAIVVNYAVKPSHGRLTAEHIHKRKLTSQIPIYFIDGTEDENEKVEHIGICLSDEELRELLEN
jgi:DNA-binding response OmpR family regulator